MDLLQDRETAGRLLAEKLMPMKGENPLVLALPRGGLPVAAPIARALGAELNILAVKKIGAPSNEEFAVGAVSEDGAPVLNEELIRRSGWDRDALLEKGRSKAHELSRQVALFRTVAPAPEVAGRTVIVVDDGLATGATLEAALSFLRSRGAGPITVAIPVVSRSSYLRFRDEVAGFQVVLIPHSFRAVSEWYGEFPQVHEEEALRLLRESAVAAKKPGLRSETRDEGPADDIWDEIQRLSRPFQSPADLEHLARRVADSRIVMLGESTHGTAEFYQVRRELSQILLRDHGFDFIAVEGDWPDCFRLTRYIRDRDEGRAESVLRGFDRWPTWMWANHEILPLIQWMRAFGAGFYGLDVYSLFESMDAIRASLAEIEDEAARDIMNRYACFEPFERNEIRYAKSLFESPRGCRDQAVRNLNDLLSERIATWGLSEPELFNARQNARIVANAEAYYRAMVEGGADSWNVRDRHMLETLRSLLERKPGSKAVVWAHNTHIGDYRATDMADNGYVNLGGLAREAFGADRVSLVGFGTYAGTVLAGRAWGSAEETMELPPARADSIEGLCHEVAARLEMDRFALFFDEASRRGPLRERRSHRAVGVVYDPSYERRGMNAVPTVLPERYDAFVFIDRTRALRSLREPAHAGQFPESYPSGM